MIEDSKDESSVDLYDLSFYNFKKRRVRNPTEGHPLRKDLKSLCLLLLCYDSPR